MRVTDLLPGHNDTGGAEKKGSILLVRTVMVQTQIQIVANWTNGY